MELAKFLNSREKDLFCRCNNCGWEATLLYSTWESNDIVVQKIRNAHIDFDEDCDTNGKEDFDISLEPPKPKEKNEPKENLPPNTKEGSK